MIDQQSSTEDEGKRKGSSSLDDIDADNSCSSIGQEDEFDEDCSGSSLLTTGLQQGKIVLTKSQIKVVFDVKDKFVFEERK